MKSWRVAVGFALRMFASAVHSAMGRPGAASARGIRARHRATLSHPRPSACSWPKSPPWWGKRLINLYSRRRRNSQLLRRYQAALQEMISLILDDASLSSQAWNYLLRFILRAKGLEDYERLTLLQRLAHPRRQETPEAEKLEKNERQDIHRWLKQLVQTCWTGSAQDRLLAQVQSRWGN